MASRECGCPNHGQRVLVGRRRSGSLVNESASLPRLLREVTPILTVLILCSAIGSAVGAPFASSFYFFSFNVSANPLTFVEDAFADNGKVYLTSKRISSSGGGGGDDQIVPLPHGVGRVLYSQPIRGRDPLTGRPVSFSTTFVFSIANPQQLQMGDGLAFLLTSNESVIGSGGGYMGLAMDNQTTWNGLSSSSAHTVAVEFDTWQNLQLLDPDSNHVGVDVDSMVSLEAATAGFWDGDFHPLPLAAGLPLQAWIDYYADLDGLIDVSISPVLGARPARPLLSLAIDLARTVQERMFVGFSAATGDLSSEHVIHAWSFNSSGPPARDFVFESHSGRLPVRWVFVGATSACLLSGLLLVTIWCWCRGGTPQTRRGRNGNSRTRRSRKRSSKVHVGDPEAVVHAADLIRDAARAQANLNISKVLVETHLRAIAELHSAASEGWSAAGKAEEEDKGKHGSDEPKESAAEAYFPASDVVEGTAEGTADSAGSDVSVLSDDHKHALEQGR